MCAWIVLDEIESTMENENYSEDFSFTDTNATDHPLDDNDFEHYPESSENNG